MTSARDPARSRPERLLAFLLAACAIVSAFEFSGRPACIDYYQFWVVGRAVAAGETGDVYSDVERKRLGEVAWQRALADAAENRPAGAEPSVPPPPTRRLQAASRRRELETFSTPWFYALFGLFSGADYDRSQDLFQRASLAAYLAGILILARILGFSLAAAALLVAALLQWFNPFVDDVIAGNVNRLQLFALSVFLWLECRTRFRGRHVLAGVLLGALLAFKPNLAAVAGVLVLGWGIAGEGRRLGASLVGQAVGVLAAVLASGAFFGSFDPWLRWMQDLPRLMAPGSPSAGGAADGNYSLPRLLRDSAGLDLGSAVLVALVLVTSASLVRGRQFARSSDPARDVRLVGIGAAISLLGTGLSWQHYFIGVLPLAMVLLRPGEEVERGRIGLALLGLALVSLQIVARLTGIQAPAAAAATVAAGTLLLLVLGLRELTLRNTD